MKFIRTGKQRVFVFTAGILVISLAVLITSVQVAMGAEEGRSIEEPATVAAFATVEPEKAGGDVIVAGLEQTGSDVTATEPEQELLTKEEAIDACVKAMVAAGIFNPDVDKGGIKAYFGDKYDMHDGNGNVKFTTNDFWYVDCRDFFASVDTVSGDIHMLDVRSGHPEGRITLEEYDAIGALSSPYGGIDMHNSPDDKYIQAAVQIVNNYVTDGRTIENVKIGATQFVWDNNSVGFDPNATGTMQVDCRVYMDTGRCYTLNFWGTDDIVLKGFMSHPTKHACQWGYFYEEEEADYPPDGAYEDGWQDATGIDGGYSQVGERTPEPQRVPSN